MKGYTTEWYERYKADRKASRAQPEQAIRHESLAKNKGKTIHPDRIQLRIVSYRRRLIDPDNLCPKYFIDCLRYAGFIFDDSETHITLVTSQEKVATKQEECTSIELT